MPGGNWASMPVVERLENELGKPILVNNAVSLWGGLRLLKRTTAFQDMACYCETISPRKEVCCCIVGEAEDLFMKLVQIFLPLYGNNGRRFPAALYARERERLVERFGGLTAHMRSPAHGRWRDGARTKRDDIIIFGGHGPQGGSEMVERVPLQIAKAVQAKRAARAGSRMRGSVTAAVPDRIIRAHVSIRRP